MRTVGQVAPVQHVCKCSQNQCVMSEMTARDHVLDAPQSAVPSLEFRPTVYLVYDLTHIAELLTDMCQKGSMAVIPHSRLTSLMQCEQPWQIRKSPGLPNSRLEVSCELSGFRRGAIWKLEKCENEERQSFRSWTRLQNKYVPLPQTDNAPVVTNVNMNTGASISNWCNYLQPIVLLNRVNFISHSHTTTSTGT